MPADATADLSDLEKQVMSTLRSQRGILNGRELYQQYGEKMTDELKTAVAGLQNRKLLVVKGDLEAPLGVFKSVLVEC